MNSSYRWFVTFACLVPPAAIAQTHDAHRHGISELSVVVEGDAVLLQLESPLHDIVGFEHAPRTGEERVRIEDAVSLLTDPSRMFGLTDDAGCEAHDVELDGPAYVTQPGTGAEDRHAHDRPSNDDSGHESHAEVSVRYVFRCDRMRALRAIEALFLDSFERLEEVRTSVVTPSGSFYYELTREQGLISLDPE